jgi:hypothetical protein
VSYASLPLSFEANQGQTDARVRFLARGGGHTIFLSADEAVFTLWKSQPGMSRFGKLAFPGRLEPLGLLGPRTTRWPQLASDWKSLWPWLLPDLGQLLPQLNSGQRPLAAGIQSPPPQVVRMRLVGGNTKARMVGLDELPGRSNYFIGNDPKRWHTNVPNYARVKYEGIYPGVDLVYHGNQHQVEYDFVVAPGADPNQMKLSFAGADGMRVDSGSGDLVVRVGDDELRLQKPVVYQPALECGSLLPLCAPQLVPGSSDARYAGLSDTNREAGFRRGKRQQAAALQSGLRPPMSRLEGRFVLARNNEVAFAVEGYDPKRALVIDPVLIYSTYLGGSGNDGANGIAVDSSGNAYVTGTTYSSDFPTVNPLQPSLLGTYDAFVAKLNPAGSAFVYSTYLGGESCGSGIAVDSGGNAYVTGSTLYVDFPTVNALQPTMLGAECDAFVAKLSPDGSELVYSTYLGSDSNGFFYNVNYQGGSAIAVDAGGNAYVAGSAGISQPTATNPAPISAFGCPFNPGTAPDDDAFVSKLNSTGSALVYSICIGGPPLPDPNHETFAGTGIAVDAAGSAYVTGYFTPPGSSNTTHAFASKLNPTGAFVYTTYLGGSSDDVGNGIAVDSAGNAYVTGTTSSTDFPITANALQPTSGGGSDAFVAKLSPDGSGLVYSTYLGGSTGDVGAGIAVDTGGNAYVVGETQSPDFPTAKPFQTCGGCPDYGMAFVSMLNPDGSALVYSTYVGGDPGGGGGIAVDSSGNAYVAGGTSSNLPTLHAAQPISGGLPSTSDAFVAIIGPADSPGIAFSPGALILGVPNPKGPIPGVPIYESGVTLTAVGSQPLIISSITTTGEFALAPPQFTPCPYTGGTLDPGATCSITVTFMPTAPGTVTGTVNVYDNASGSPQTVSLTGIATTPPVAGVSPATLSFGSETLGTPSGSQPVLLRNTGNPPLVLSGIVTSGDFSQTNNCGSSVAANSSCTINVTFTPTAAGTRNGTLTITDDSNWVAGSTQRVSLTGTGPVPVASVSPLSLNFGIQLLSTTSAAQTVTVSNSGTASLTLTAIGITGANSSDFSQNNNCPISPNTFAPGASCQVSATFAPTASGPRKSGINVKDSAGDSLFILLTGVGTAVGISPASLSFPSQSVGTSGTPQTVTLSNLGSAPVNIWQMVLRGANAGDFSKSTTCGASLAAGSSCGITMTFTPSAAGTLSASLLISDDGGGSPQSVSLSGIGAGDPSDITSVSLSAHRASAQTAKTPQ